MAAEKSYSWTNNAISRCARLNPSDDEIDAIDGCMVEVLAGKYDVAPVLFRGLEKQFLFKCGRFRIVFWYPNEDNDDDIVAEITDVTLFSEGSY
jgi:hypothetical protein